MFILIYFKVQRYNLFMEKTKKNQNKIHNTQHINYLNRNQSKKERAIHSRNREHRRVKVYAKTLFWDRHGGGEIQGRCMLYLYKHNPGLTIHTPSHTGSSFGDWRGGLVGDGDFGVAGDFTEAAAAVDAAVDMSVAAEGDIGGVGHFAGFAAAEDIAGVGVAGGGADAAVAGDGEGDLTLNGAKGVEILVGVEDMVGVVDADRIAFRPGVGSGLAFDAGAVGTEFGIVVRLHSKAYRIHLDGGQGGGEACAIDIAVHDARGQGGGNRA